jgi:outer membrane protein TolC
MADGFELFVEQVQQLASEGVQLRAERNDVDSQLQVALAQVEALQGRLHVIEERLAQVEGKQLVSSVHSKPEATVTKTIVGYDAGHTA